MRTFIRLAALSVVVQLAAADKCTDEFHKVSEIQRKRAARV